MKDQMIERTVWRIEEDQHFLFNAEAWKSKPLPIMIWCKCGGLTAVSEIPCLYTGTPIEASDICQKCGKEVKVEIEFVDYSKPSRPTLQSDFPEFADRLFRIDRDESGGLKPLILNSLDLGNRVQAVIECDCGNLTIVEINTSGWGESEESVTCSNTCCGKPLNFRLIIADPAMISY